MKQTQRIIIIIVCGAILFTAGAIFGWNLYEYLIVTGRLEALRGRLWTPFINA